MWRQKHRLCFLAHSCSLSHDQETFCSRQYRGQDNRQVPQKPGTIGHHAHVCTLRAVHICWSRHLLIGLNFFLAQHEYCSEKSSDPSTPPQGPREYTPFLQPRSCSFQPFHKTSRSIRKHTTSFPSQQYIISSDTHIANARRMFSIVIWRRPGAGDSP